MTVDIHTKMITLLGTPLAQSFAARMQNRGYDAAGLNMLYFYTEIDNDHLGDVVNGMEEICQPASSASSRFRPYCHSERDSQNSPHPGRETSY